ncbi:MAG TPA: response regulator [Roseiflexaceae bacterium]|nr:response regulator [Roseiflexaceae bacterium]
MQLPDRQVRAAARFSELDEFDATAFDNHPLWSIRPPAVVVVDDDQSLVELLGRVLRTAVVKYETVVLTDAAEALAQCASRPVPLMIVDLNMPGMNGLQLIAQMRARSPQTRVLLMTAYTMPILEQLARKGYIDYYLPKPFQIVTLEQLVSAALATS